MKRFLALLALAACCALPAPAADAPPLFSPDPPDPAAAALVNAYLPLLAAGEFDQALALNDLRGMRQYLLNRRLTELKTKNSELTAADLETLSAQIQVNDLNPARLQDILRQMMTEAGYAGMTWRVRGYAPAPQAIDGFLVSVDARSADGKEKPVLLGIKKLGDQWMIAPEVIEELMGRQPVVRPAPSVPTPDPVAAAVDAFWTHWREGDLDKAYELFGAEHRARLPLLAFLQQAQAAIEKVGVPTSWTIAHCREIAPATLGLGVDVQGATAPLQTIMIFRKQGETWTLLDTQFRAPGSPLPPARPLSRPDLQTDLQPDLAPPPPPAPAPAP